MPSQTKRAKLMRRMRRTETRNAKRLRNKIRYAAVKLYVLKDCAGEHAQRMRRYYKTLQALAKEQYNALSRKERGLC